MKAAHQIRETSWMTFMMRNMHLRLNKQQQKRLLQSGLLDQDLMLDNHHTELLR